METNLNRIFELQNKNPRKKTFIFQSFTLYDLAEVKRQQVRVRKNNARSKKGWNFKAKRNIPGIKKLNWTKMLFFEDVAIAVADIRRAERRRKKQTVEVIRDGS